MSVLHSEARPVAYVADTIGCAFAYAVTWLVLLGLAASLASGAKAESYLPKIGGSGGSQFNARCPTGNNLTGFELRVGDDVDAIRAVCVVSYGPREISTPPLTTGSGLVEIHKSALGSLNEVAPGWHGGPGGRIERLFCPARTPIVIGVDVQTEGVDTRIVNSIWLYCGEAALRQTLQEHPSAVFEGPAYVASAGWLGMGVGGDSGMARTQSQRCPTGEVAVGISGRSGVWLDALGLICDTPNLDNSRPPPKVLGRAKPSGTPSSSLGPCEAARLASARNSPAAAGLEARCRNEQALATKPQAPIKTLGPVRSLPAAGPPLPICESARLARARSSPAAPGLDARCRALEAQAAADAAALGNPPEPE